MGKDQDLGDFIQGSFGSVWALELALKLAADPARIWTPGEMVSALRASELVVARAVHDLEASGLIVIEPGDAFRYAPASEELAALIDLVRDAYMRSPDKIRRTIVGTRSTNLTAFADAFRIRKDHP